MRIRGKGLPLHPQIEMIKFCIAEMAQLVEHFIRNERVPGSSPGFGSERGCTKNRWYSLFLYLKRSFSDNKKGFFQLLQVKEIFLKLIRKTNRLK